MSGGGLARRRLYSCSICSSQLGLSLGLGWLTPSSSLDLRVASSRPDCRHRVHCMMAEGGTPQHRCSYIYRLSMLLFFIIIIFVCFPCNIYPANNNPLWPRTSAPVRARRRLWLRPPTCVYLYDSLFFPAVVENTRRSWCHANTRRQHPHATVHATCSNSQPLLHPLLTPRRPPTRTLCLRATVSVYL